MSEVLVLHNPGALRGKQSAAVVRRWVAQNGDRRATRFVTLDELESAELPSRKLVAVGGDGTLNAALSWLHARGADVPLGIVPAGTGNSLARSLGVPRESGEACRFAFESDAIRSLDALLYRADESEAPLLMVQSGVLGFPAEISLRYDRLRRRPLLKILMAPFGSLIYNLLALAGLASQKRRESRGDRLLTVRCRLPAGETSEEEETLEERVLALFVQNVPTVGGDFIPAPAARVDDGAVDLCLVRAGTGASYLKMFDMVSRGEHVHLKSTIVIRQSPGPIELRLSKPSPFVVDGELVLQSQRYLLELLPSRFRVVAPD